MDAQKIAIETKSRVNVVMLGAMAKVMGFVELEALNAICEASLGKKYPAALSGNLEGIKRGFEEVKKAADQYLDGKSRQAERKAAASFLFFI